MLVGLSGTHGTGKTTLGEAAAEQFGCAFIKTNVSEVMRRLGKDPRIPMTFMQRLDCQFAILDAQIQQWRTAKQHEISITDRTPIDMVGYTLSAVDSYSSLTEAEDDRLQSYLRLCDMVTKELFDRVAMLPMGKFEAVRNDDKVTGHMCYGNRILLQTLMYGSIGRIIELKPEYVISLETVSIEDRIRELREFIGLTFDAALYA